jgi:riboflavin synthase
MFTGIIEGLGTIAALQRSARGCRMAVEADFDLGGTRIGDSLAVNGACLTTVVLGPRRFEVDLSPESLATTTFDQARIGERVNLERALRLSDRLDGHLVSGHVDGIATLQQRSESGNSLRLSFRAPPPLTRYMITKGSVAVDGVSLTINRCQAAGFEVCIIPHTARLTTVGLKRPGERVNIETDLIGKYVERFTPGAHRTVAAERDETTGIDREFLAKSGFL